MISACLVTRGDVPLDEQVKEIEPHVDEVCVWDNSKFVDMGVFGRFCAVSDLAKHDLIFFQDDDVVFHDMPILKDKYALYGGNVMVATDGHGGNYGGYEDLAWTGQGSLVSKKLIDETWKRWFAHYPGLDPTNDDFFLLEADAVFGILCPHVQLNLRWTRLFSDHPTREHLCRMPWQEKQKLRFANMARKIRDGGTR